MDVFARLLLVLTLALGAGVWMIHLFYLWMDSVYWGAY